MLRRIGFGLAFAIAAYLVAAFASNLLIDALSSNRGDRAVEAAMTSAFVFGPLGAIVGFVAGCIVGGRHAASSQSDRS